MAEDPKSKYSKIELPVFESKIPTHLVNKMSDQERWLVETMSKLDQKTDWLISKILEANRQVIDLDVLVSQISEWKSLFTGKWAILAGLVFIIATASTSAVVRSIFDHFTTQHP